MGWDGYPGMTKAQVLADYIRQEKARGGYIAHYHYVHSAEESYLWVARKDDKFSYMAVHMFEKTKTSGWCVKSLDETVGPYVFNCSAILLDRTGPDDHPDRPDLAKRWRARVREELKLNKWREELVEGNAVSTMISNFEDAKFVATYDSKTVVVANNNDLPIRVYRSAVFPPGKSPNDIVHNVKYDLFSQRFFD